MKAAYITKYGGTEVIESGELPGPVLTKDKVLVRVKAVSLNPIDTMIRRGEFKLMTGSAFPKVLGADFSGVIMEVGSSVKDFNKGDRIYGGIPLFTGIPGALSEFACVLPKRIRKIPEGMTFEDAASIPVGALTALNGLRKSGNVEGKSLLINGATGGVGNFAVQIARIRGARIIATCSAKNRELAKQLGAHEVIGYSKEDMDRITVKFDIIFDVFGKMNYDIIFRLLNNKGVYLSTKFMHTAMFPSFLTRVLFDKKLTSAYFRGKPEDYREIEDLYRDGRIKPFIGRIFSAEETRHAYEIVEQQGARGKTIIKWY